MFYIKIEKGSTVIFHNITILLLIK